MTAPVLDVRRPPPRWRLAFFVLGLRLPAEHRAWVASVLRSDAEVRRVSLLRLVPILVWGVVFVIVALRSSDDGYAGLGGIVGATVGSLAGAWWWHDRNRRRMLRWQRVDIDGRPVEARGIARLGNLAAVLLIVGLLVGGLLVFRWFLISLD